MNQEKISFLLFGKIPPPIGGVTISIQNLRVSLDTIGLENCLINKSHLLSFKKYDIGHIHYSKKWKVIVAILLSHVLCKKTIVTKHGAEFYPSSKILDKIILMLTDGMIVLNKEVYKRCIEKKNLIKLPPIFKEGIVGKKSSKNQYFKRKAGYKYLLVYASGKVYIDGNEVYGISFSLEAVKKLSVKTILIVLDPKGEYENEVKEVTSSIIYLNEYIDFNSLVSNVDLYLRPTSSDGSSIAVLEALSHGIPVLASDVVERGENIEIYKHENKEEFIEKIEYLLNNKLSNSSVELPSIKSYVEFCLKTLN